MESIRELHDQIMNHPYRLGSDLKYKNHYTDLLYKLDRAVNGYMLKHKRLGWFTFSHDFCSAIGRREMHVERILHCIHKLIDSGEIPDWYTEYTGCNILESMNRLRKWIYKSGKMIPVYELDELNKCIDEIEKYRNTHKEVSKFGPHSDDWYNYLLDYKKKHFNGGE